ncbi:unnamed protein product [Phaeothamnion confervicola]
MASPAIIGSHGANASCQPFGLPDSPIPIDCVSALMNILTKPLSRYRRAVAAVALAAVLGAVFIGGAQPFAVNLIPAPWDKLAHFMLFALISAAIGLASGRTGARMVSLAVAGTLLLGMGDELRQWYLPGRNAGLDDLLADLLGALAGAVGLTYFQKAQNI